MGSGQPVRKMHMQTVLFMMFFSLPLKKLSWVHCKTSFFLPIATQGELNFPLRRFWGVREAETVNIFWKFNILCSAGLIGRTELETLVPEGI